MRHENSNDHGPSIVMGNSNKGRRPEPPLDTMDFASMSIDKLQKLQEMVDAVLAKKIAAEIIVLEWRKRLPPSEAPWRDRSDFGDAKVTGSSAMCPMI